MIKVIDCRSSIGILYLSWGVREAKVILDQRANLEDLLTHTHTQLVRYDLGVSAAGYSADRPVAAQVIGSCG